MGTFVKVSKIVKNVVFLFFLNASIKINFVFMSILKKNIFMSSRFSA